MNINQGFIFPWHFRLFGGLLIIGGAVVIALNIIVAVIMLLIGLLLLAGRSGISFDMKNAHYKDFNSFLGFKFGHDEALKEIEKLYINRNMQKSTMYSAHTSSAKTFENIIYDGYLKFVDGEKMYLKSLKKKELLMNELQELANYLNTHLIDNTES